MISPLRVEFKYEGNRHVFEHPLQVDHIANAHKAGVFYETPLLKHIQAAKKKGLYLDVGAHIGNHSVFFSRYCPSERVWSFEPSPASFRCLVRNLASNAAVNVSPFCCAIGSAPGTVRLASSTKNNSGMNRYEDAPIGIPVFSIDQLAQGRSVSVVKMDVEGFEIPALQGAAGVLQRCKPMVIVEAQTPKEDQEQIKFLTGAGYVHAGRFCATPTHVWMPR